jgi:hypothetical protein
MNNMSMRPCRVASPTASLLAVILLLLPAVSAADQSSVNNVDPAFILLNAVPAAYHAVYGEYPAKWADVVNAGLVQVTLRTSEGIAIDPDDSKFDFKGDCVYIYQGAQQAPVFFRASSRDGLVVKRHQCGSSGGSYLAAFENYESAGISVPAEWKSEAARIRFAMASLMNQVVTTHATLCQDGTTVASMTELLQIPFSPYDRDSVDPVTGAPLAGSGSTGFIMEISPDTVNVPGQGAWQLPPSIYPTDSAGEPIKTLSF